MSGRRGRQNSGLGKLCCICLEMELVMEERKYMVSKNMEKDIWKIMYDKAREVQNERERFLRSLKQEVLRQRY